MKEILQSSPVIAAVKDARSLEAACLSPAKVVFLLSGSITDLPDKVQQIKRAGKRVFVHVDLIDGLKPDKQGILYISKTVRPHGIISTRPATIKLAAGCGLQGVLRIFMIDASAFHTGLQGISACHPALVEVMPGLLPGIIAKLRERVLVPIVAGGMIEESAQALVALKSGAVAISTSRESLWYGLTEK